MFFELLLILSAVFGGAVASVAGFGIGSLLTPVLASRVGTKLAVAAISIPHAAGTAVRLWKMRAHIDRGVLWSFGLASAAGGLTGALLHSLAGGPILTALFAALLLFAGFAGVTGLAKRFRFRGVAAWIAGGLSGLFGGLVGNQGGIRSAALLGFDIARDAFVGTATAIALLIDAARLPVYLATEGGAIAGLWRQVLLMIAGVVFGTLVGRRLLARIPESVFRPLVSGLILALGVYMVFLAWKQW